MKPKVVIDIDGVMADFTLGFTRLASEVCGSFMVRIKGAVEQSTWRFRDDPDNPAFSKQNENEVWDVIRESETFWADMPSLTSEADDHALNVLAETHDIVYVTDRSVGVDPVGQTVQWLAEQDLPNPYHVLCRRVLGLKKATLVGLLDPVPVAALEDSPNNLPEMDAMFQTTLLFRMVRKYNDCCPGWPVNTVAEFCTAVKAERPAHA